MSLGENLQFLRKKSEITQEQLAEKLEVSRQSVSKWESDAAYPEMDKIIQICDLFHVGMDDLVRKDVSLGQSGGKGGAGSGHPAHGNCGADSIFSGKLYGFHERLK